MTAFSTTLHRRRVIGLFAASAALAAAPARASAGEEVRRWRGMAMGAGASLAIRHEDPNEAARLIALARAEIERLEAIFSLYRTDSALSRLNAAGRLAAPPAELLELLSICGVLNGATDGAFDPAIQSLWAYHAEVLSGARRADDAAFRGIFAASGWRRVMVDTNEIRLASRSAALTLNGIAQGYATDKVAALLRAEGLRNVLVSVGEIVAFGERGHGAPWRIGLTHFPEDEADEKIEITDGAIATTAPLATTLDPAGRISHIIDPGTGAPAAGQWRQISVLHSSAAVADGLSTGMALMDRRAIERLVAAHGKLRVIAFGEDGERYETGAI